MGQLCKIGNGILCASGNYRTIRNEKEYPKFCEHGVEFEFVDSWLRRYQNGIVYVKLACLRHVIHQTSNENLNPGFFKRNWWWWWWWWWCGLCCRLQRPDCRGRNPRRGNLTHTSKLPQYVPAKTTH